MTPQERAALLAGLQQQTAGAMEFADSVFDRAGRTLPTPEQLEADSTLAQRIARVAVAEEERERQKQMGAVQNLARVAAELSRNPQLSLRTRVELRDAASYLEAKLPRVSRGGYNQSRARGMLENSDRSMSSANNPYYDSASQRLREIIQLRGGEKDEPSSTGVSLKSLLAAAAVAILGSGIAFYASSPSSPANRATASAAGAVGLHAFENTNGTTLIPVPVLSQAVNETLATMTPEQVAHLEENAVEVLEGAEQSAAVKELLGKNNGTLLSSVDAEELVRLCGFGSASSNEVTDLLESNLQMVGNPCVAAKIATSLDRGLIDKDADFCQDEPEVCKGHCDVPRYYMPQLMDEPIGKLLNSKKAKDRMKGAEAVRNGASPTDPRPITEIFIDILQKKGIKVTRGVPVKLSDLKATQREIKTLKSYIFGLAQMQGRFKDKKTGKLTDIPCDWTQVPIIVSNDGYIVDGHHRWAAVKLVNPELYMNAVVIDMPIAELLAETWKHPELGTFAMDLQDKINRDLPADLDAYYQEKVDTAQKKLRAQARAEMGEMADWEQANLLQKTYAGAPSLVAAQGGGRRRMGGGRRGGYAMM